MTEIENARTDHRHGQAWTPSEPGAIGFLFKPWQENVALGVILALLGAWLVWG